MEKLIEVLEGKLDKHTQKLKDHKETEEILKTEYENLKNKGDNRQERVGEKLLSTIKNVEYHTAKCKTYKKVIAMMEEEIKKELIK